MQAVGTWLRDFFAVLVYPLVIIGTCVLLFGTVIFITIRAKSARAVIAALLPIAALPFLLVTQTNVADPVMRAIGDLYESTKFAIGAGIAIVLIEIGRFLLRRESEVGPAIFIFFLGSTGSFIVYALMTNVLASTHFLFFGFVFGGGFYMILRGVPLPRSLLRDWPFGNPSPARRQQSSPLRTAPIASKPTTAERKPEPIVREAPEPKKTPPA